MSIRFEDRFGAFAQGEDLVLRQVGPGIEHAEDVVHQDGDNAKTITMPIEGIDEASLSGRDGPFWRGLRWILSSRSWLENWLAESGSGAFHADDDSGEKKAKADEGEEENDVSEVRGSPSTTLRSGASRSGR